LSQHNIIGSEAFEGHKIVQIRRYAPRGATWKTYAVSAMVGGAMLFGLAAAIIYAAQNLLAR
jgi:hypothetical protein